MFEGLGETVDEVRGFVNGLEPRCIDGEQARELVVVLATLERLASAGKALAAGRVAETGAWKESDARSPAHWLAKVSGSSVADAAAALQSVRVLDALPDTEAAFREGELSGPQMRHITDAAKARPEVERELLDAARTESLGGLRNEARNHLARTEDESERYERIHRSRYFRARVSKDGAVTGEFRLTPDAGSELLSALAPFQDAAFRRARSEQRHEPIAAHAADGFREMANAAAGNGERPGARRRDTKTIIRIDVDALLRGHVEGDEVCEIAGIGPIPVELVRSKLGESFLALVFTKGEAVQNVTHLGRRATAKQLTALQWQGVVCECEGCDERSFLELDHLVDWALTHHTRLDELGFKCAHHHRLKTHRGWDFVPGTTRMVPPDDPHHPRNRPPGRSPDQSPDRPSEQPPDRSPHRAADTSPMPVAGRSCAAVA